jgi:hypothetical protein
MLSSGSVSYPLGCMLSSRSEGTYGVARRCWLVDFLMAGCNELWGPEDARDAGALMGSSFRGAVQKCSALAGG